MSPHPEEDRAYDLEYASYQPPRTGSPMALTWLMFISASVIAGTLFGILARRFSLGDIGPVDRELLGSLLIAMMVTAIGAVFVGLPMLGFRARDIEARTPRPIAAAICGAIYTPLSFESYTLVQMLLRHSPFLGVLAVIYWMIVLVGYPFLVGHILGRLRS